MDIATTISYSAPPEERIIPMGHGSVLSFQGIGIFFGKVVDDMNETYEKVDVGFWESFIWFVTESTPYAVFLGIEILFVVALITRFFLSFTGIKFNIGINKDSWIEQLVAMLSFVLFMILLFVSMPNLSALKESNIEHNIMTKYEFTGVDYTHEIDGDNGVHMVQVFDKNYLGHGYLEFWVDEETGEPRNAELDKYGKEEGLRRAN